MWLFLSFFLARQTFMKTRRLGQNGPLSSVVGLGCMGMSDFYGPADCNESIATVKLTIESGINLLDTGDFYGRGHNELLLAEALKGIPRDHITQCEIRRPQGS